MEKGAQMNYNILTSSDNMLVPQIMISLTAIAKNLSHDIIDFYLMHSQITEGNLQLLSALCSGYKNIIFHEIRINDPEIFDPFVRAGNWYRETYFPLCAHWLLPDTVERILYLDAGDTLILGDIGPYYTTDFEDNFLIVTGERYKVENGIHVGFASDDINNTGFLPGILKGLFNSGSYMINLKKLRESGVDIMYYYELTQQLQNRMQRNEDFIYFGDQGPLSAAFIGDLKYYGYFETQDEWYSPYNFCLGYYDHFDQKPDFDPIVLHFAGVPFRPWKANYPVFPARFNQGGFFAGVR